LLRQDGDIPRLLDKLLGGQPPEVRRCLHVVALLSRIGWSGELEKEGQVVATFLHLDWNVVKFHVHDLNRRLGIVPQAGRFRYISPRPLGLFLALEAVSVYGDDLRNLAAQLPGDEAREAFYERLSELAEFPAARRWCREELDRFFSLCSFWEEGAARLWSRL